MSLKLLTPYIEKNIKNTKLKITVKFSDGWGIFDKIEVRIPDSRAWGIDITKDGDCYEVTVKEAGQKVSTLTVKEIKGNDVKGAKYKMIEFINSCLPDGSVKHYEE